MKKRLVIILGILLLLSITLSIIFIIWYSDMTKPLETYSIVSIDPSETLYSLEDNENVITLTFYPRFKGGERIVYEFYINNNVCEKVLTTFYYENKLNASRSYNHNKHNSAYRLIDNKVITTSINTDFIDKTKDDIITFFEENRNLKRINL